MVNCSCFIRFRSSPFLVPAQPISTTVLTLYCVSCRFRGRGTHSSSNIRMGQDHVFGDLDDSDRLVRSDAGEVVEKFGEGISGGEIVEEGFDGDAGAHEDWSSA